MKGLLSKLSRASLLFTRIPDFLFLCSLEFLFPAQLPCWSVFVYPSSVGNTAKIRGGLLIFEGWAHYSFITFWIHREVKELWSLLVPGLNYLYLFLQKSEDRLHHDTRSRAGLPTMLMPWPHSRHLVGTSALTTSSDPSRVIMVLPSGSPGRFGRLKPSNSSAHNWQHLPRWKDWLWNLQINVIKAPDSPSLEPAAGLEFQELGLAVWGW